MTDYTGGTFSYTSHDGSAYVVAGGTDLGLIINGYSLHDMVMINERWYDNYRAPTEAVIEGQEVWFDANAAEVDFSSGNLGRIFHTTTDGTGYIESRGTDLVGSSPTYYETYIYFLDGKPCLRLYMPRAYFIPNGDMEGGANVFDKVFPFRIRALAKTSIATENLRLVQYQNSTDATDLTVVPSPADGASGQAVDVAITLTFSEAIGSVFQTNASYYIKLVKNTGAQVTLTITWNAAGTVATCAHANLDASSTYLLIVSGEIRASTGKYLCGDGSTAHTWQVNDFATT